MAKTDLQLSAMGDDGKPVDWWFIYKGAAMYTNLSNPVFYRPRFIKTNK
jgi:hypothetical protein